MSRLALIFFVSISSFALTACSQSPAQELDNRFTRLEPGTETFIRIFKQENELELWLKAPNENQYELSKTFPICAWSGALGPKLREGDGQSPEGFYRVGLGSLNPNSSFHLSFNLGFPNAYDRAHGRTGSYLMVHGACASIGCYAMTDAGIEEIYAAVETTLRSGQTAVSVHVFPFRLT
ncbi:MAG: L,D-transpeptidase family protein, partial [Pseudomonadota bacterium]